MTEIEALIRELHDRQSIRDLMAAYCRGVDRFDRALLLSAYHPDAVDDHGMFIGDREAFADWAFALHGEHQTSTHHAITTHSCEIEGDVAHAETYFMMTAMNREGLPYNMAGGRYIDRLEKRDGRWGIVVRKCVRDWVASYQNWLTPAEAAARAEMDRAARDSSDPSYQRPLEVSAGRRALGVEIAAARRARIAEAESAGTLSGKTGVEHG